MAYIGSNGDVRLAAVTVDVTMLIPIQSSGAIVLEPLVGDATITRTGWNAPAAATAAAITAAATITHTGFIAVAAATTAAAVGAAVCGRSFSAVGAATLGAIVGVAAGARDWVIQLVRSHITKINYVRSEIVDE